MDYFFNPKSVAIVGASRNPMKFGSVILANLFNIDYEGKIFPVNSRGEDIAGMKTYKSVRLIPDEVELAILAIPASGIINAMKDCAEKSVKGVVIISSGFDESGEAGAGLQQEMLEIARSAGIRIVGPNTTGILNTYDRFTTTFVPLREIRKGPVAFIAQTGMFAGMLLEWILSTETFGISKVAGLGNKCDVDDAEMLEYLAEDKYTKAIMMYVEAIKDGRRFMEAARKVTRIKPVFALKSGRTAEGATAAMSHTGSLAGNDEIASAAFRQVGITRVDSFQRLIDYAKLLAYQPVARGNRLAIISLSGGGAVMSTDAAIKAGFRLAPFSEQSLAEMKKHYPSWATLRHPFDIEPLTETIGFQPAFEMSVRCALSNPEADLCLVATWTPFPEAGYSFDFIHDLQQEFPGKPVAFCSIGYKDSHDALSKRLESLNIPVYSSFTRSIDALAASMIYGEYLLAIGEQPLRHHPKEAPQADRPQGRSGTAPSKINAGKENSKDNQRVRIYFDGASRGNPGPAAIGIVIGDFQGKKIREISEAIGKTTNNYAEYSALVRGLDEARKMGAIEVECFSDSELVVRQINGIYRVKSEALLPLFEKAQTLIKKFNSFSIQHVPRSQNTRADKLASEALKKS